MFRNLSLSGAGLVLIGFSALMTPVPADAAVFCKRVGVPKGCVVRPVAPVARAVVRPGTPLNRGGPVNRVGRR